MKTRRAHRHAAGERNRLKIVAGAHSALDGIMFLYAEQERNAVNFKYLLHRLETMLDRIESEFAKEVRAYKKWKAKNK